MVCQKEKERINPSAHLLHRIYNMYVYSGTTQCPMSFIKPLFHAAAAAAAVVVAAVIAPSL